MIKIVIETDCHTLGLNPKSGTLKLRNSEISQENWGQAPPIFVPPGVVKPGLQMRHVICAEEGGSAHGIVKRSQARSLTIRNQARIREATLSRVFLNRSIDKTSTALLQIETARAKNTTIRNQHPWFRHGHP